MHSSYSDFNEMQPVTVHKLSTQKSWPPVQLFQHNYFAGAILESLFHSVSFALVRCLYMEKIIVEQPKQIRTITIAKCHF